MATAAFKSNSKRSNGYGERDSHKANPNPPPQKPKLRRSLSVNALSRSTQIDISSEFLNKRDNPLYWATGGSPTADKNTETPTPIEVAGGGGALESRNLNVGVGQRGRSVKRNSDFRNGGQKEEIGGRRRSLSRVNDKGGGPADGRRGRSVSRAKSAYDASQSEAEKESRKSVTGKLPVAGVKELDSRKSHLSRHPSVSSSFDSQFSNWEDGISTSSLSEAEEKTIKAVYEQMKSFEGNNSRKDTTSSEIYETVRSEVRRAISDIQDDLQDAIRRTTTGTLISTNANNISSNLVKPGAVELVLDIRREYAKELEESQERARKLRSELAIEEHRRQELSRILKETLPEPKSSNSHRSRLGRKSSSERKKMSKRLTDEAMSYFDECVSISTIDSSDFSAAEDPSVNSVKIDQNRCVDQQVVHDDPGSCSVADNSCNEPASDRVGEFTDGTTEWDRNFRFSFGHKPTENIELQQNIKSYIKTFEKEKRIDGITSRTNYNTNVYELLDVNESLLFDKVLLKNRQESGSLHICGGVVVPFLPFALFF